MRLWHKDLIPVLPRQQLIGQWRECCLIAKTIAEKGTPNHILVNRIMDYPPSHFATYGYFVADEIRKRGYNFNIFKFTNEMEKFADLAFVDVPYVQLFTGWHTDRYLAQCFYNLQEKYDCGGMAAEEWAKIDEMWIEKLFTFKMDVEKM